MMIIQDLINITNICIDQFKTIRQTCIKIYNDNSCMYALQTDGHHYTCKLQIYIKHYFSR